MKILVIGTIDNKGGAAGVSWELRRRLKADGHTVSTFVRYKYSDEPDVFVIPRKRYQDWLVKFFANDLRFANTGYIFDTKEYKEADLVHCHNLHSNFFNLRDLIRMSREKPVVWTIHDLWAITGFSNDKATLKNPNKKKFLFCLWDTTSRLLATKKKIYDRSKLRVVAVSDWLKSELEKSVLRNQNITRIENGIDTLIFKPYDKQTTRLELGLPTGKKIVGFFKKGWVDSKKLVETYHDRDDVIFLSLNNVPWKDKRVIPIPEIKEGAPMAKYLSAMDVLLYPTTGDTFGLVAAEAMACGTPVVTYDTDALPEIVVHRETGFLVPREDISGAKYGIEYILGLSQKEYENIQKHSRDRAMKLFTSERMYREYLELYKKAISERERQKTGSRDSVKHAPEIL
ncbi:MAG: glycosyltransferase [Patescibacteria group bacterium]